MNPFIMGLGNARYNEFVQSARMENLASKARCVVGQHPLSRIGALFIKLGTQLKASGDSSMAKRLAAKLHPFRRVL